MCEYDCPFFLTQEIQTPIPEAGQPTAMSLKEVGQMAGSQTQLEPYRQLKAQKGKRPPRAPLAPRAPGPEEEDPRVSRGRHVL